MTGRTGPRPSSTLLVRRALWRITRIVLVVVIAHHGIVYAVQRHLLFPGTWMPLPETTAPAGVERISIATDAGTAFAYLKQANAATAQKPAPLIVYAHGNAERAVDFPWWTEPYTYAGFHVLIIEYRGFGGSDGSPSEAGIVGDALGLIELAVARPDVDAERVVYHGRSLGGGVVAILAAHRRPSGLILESSFSSVASMARDMLAPGYLMRDPFDTARVLGESYDGPTLILHGDADDVIPVQEARRNFAAAGGENARLIVGEGRGHIDSWMALEPDLLLEFVRGVSQ